MADVIERTHNFKRFVAVAAMDWRWPFTWTDSTGATRNVAGFTFTGKIRAAQSSTSASIADLSFDMSNAASGVVVPFVARATTASVAVTDDTPYWLEIEYLDSSGYRYPLLAGPLEVKPRSVA